MTGLRKLGAVALVGGLLVLVVAADAFAGTQWRVIVPLRHEGIGRRAPRRYRAPRVEICNVRITVVPQIRFRVGDSVVVTLNGTASRDTWHGRPRHYGGGHVPHAYRPGRRNTQTVVYVRPVQPTCRPRYYGAMRGVRIRSRR